MTAIRFKPTTTQFVNEHSTIQLNWPIWLTIWLNSWVFVYELNGCGFESSCSHLFNGIFPTDLKPGMQEVCFLLKTFVKKNIYIQITSCKITYIKPKMERTCSKLASLSCTNLCISPFHNSHVNFEESGRFVRNPSDRSLCSTPPVNIRKTVFLILQSQLWKVILCIINSHQ